MMQVCRCGRLGFAEANSCDNFVFLDTNMQVDRCVKKQVAAEFAEQ